MGKLLITHPMDRETVRKLKLELVDLAQRERLNLGDIHETLYYALYAEHKVLYIPQISLQQLPEEKNDPSITLLMQALTSFQPEVLIVGNNAVPKRAIAAWRKAVGNEKPLLTIRRGVDTRAIDKTAASEYRVAIDNLPGINSPYVAQHMLKYLNLSAAQPHDKIAIVGVGEIGKVIARAAIAQGLTPYLLSPSLQNPQTRLPVLLQRGIDPQRVTCVASLGEAIAQATYLSVAIPWENSDGSTNADRITVEHIRSLASFSSIVSASVPRVFSQPALEFMNALVPQGHMRVRIDTSKRRAQEAKQLYPHLDISHDEAFAAPQCQQKLDNVMLEKAYKFLQSPSSIAIASKF